MEIETTRFGRIDMDDARMLYAPEGLPGFEGLTRYALVSEEESYPILWLQAADDPDVALPVLDIFNILPDYAIDVEAEELSPLHDIGDGSLLVLCVVVIPENISGMTANLASPVLVNTETGRMKQIIRDERDLPMRRPIFADIVKALEGGAARAGADAQK